MCHRLGHLLDFITNMKMRLLLFDIDGTLVNINGAGRKVLKQALQEVFGTAGPIDDYSLAGTTDSQTIYDLLTATGFSIDEIEDGLPSVYQTMAEKGKILFFHDTFSPCPGVKILLDRLASSKNILLGLMTGNAESTAPLKLTAAQIDPACFQVGSFGSDAQDRNQLPGMAMKRASAKVGETFDGSNTVIIGDTPADIACARASGATAVAVATGGSPLTTLAKYEPDYLLDNLANLDLVLKILLLREGD